MTDHEQILFANVAELSRKVERLEKENKENISLLSNIASKEIHGANKRFDEIDTRFNILGEIFAEHEKHINELLNAKVKSNKESVTIAKDDANFIRHLVNCIEYDCGLDCVHLFKESIKYNANSLSKVLKKYGI